MKPQMPDAGSRSVDDNNADASIELIASTLRVVDGVALDHAQPFAAALPPPTRLARGRQDEHLLFFFRPSRATSPDLCRDLREVVARVYWSTPGSVTAALRRAASATNHFLFEHNLNAESSSRCYGGLSCAVIRERDLFLLQAGPGWACVLRAEKLRCLPRGVNLAHLGIGPLADVRLHHVLAAVGDTLLLASPALLREAGEDGLVRVLARQDVGDVMEGLEHWGDSADFTALVVRWERATLAEASVATELPVERPSQVSSPVSPATIRPYEMPEPIEKEVPVVEDTAAEFTAGGRQQPPSREPKPPKKAFVIAAGRVLQGILRGAARGLTSLWHAVAAVGAGLAALGKWLIGAIGTTIRNTLPGVDRAGAYRSHRRPPPEENRAISIAVAVAIPVLVAAVIAVAHVKLAARSRFQGVIQQAEGHIALAQAAPVGSEEARAHWGAALEQAEAAAALQPEDPAAQVLRDQVRDALDRLDRVERLMLTQLADFGSSNADRRLALSDQELFVLDPREGWGARVPLDRIDEGDDAQDLLVLVRTGQRVEGLGVDRLVDCAWIRRAGGRQSSALLVLEENGRVLSYDPAWGTESGAPHLVRLELSRPLPERPVAVGSYEGQFYILDAAAENGGQIWRYRPRGDAYPESPEPYFSERPPLGLETAVDMAIDGHIYVLHDDGTVHKFLGGELVQFEITGVPGGLAEVSDIAVDSRGSGAVYVLDRGNDRLIQLHADGSFQAQFRADDVFEGLEALAVSETEKQLYVLDAGRLYAASLP